MNLTLYLFKAAGDPKVFNVRKGKTIIGRREDCDLRIPLSQVSRKHAMLLVQEGAVSIRDLGSVNGTFVNNERVSEQKLAAGDHIVIGPVVFTVQIDGKPEKVPRIKTRIESRSVMDESDVRQTVPPGLRDSTGSQGDQLVTDEDEDPISALELLAGTGDTRQIDLEDSDIDLTMDDSDI
jgi:pSer/pThr/pTyr-binding forkhead associated (FHA) protein